MRWGTGPAMAALMMSALVLAGCSPTGSTSGPSPTPTPVPSASASPDPSPTPSPSPSGPPALAELVASPEGVGSLVLGEPLDPSLATWDRTACLAEDMDQPVADDQTYGAFVPNYPMAIQTAGDRYPRFPFEPHHGPDKTLNWIRVRSAEIRTAAGVGIGSSDAEVRAAYPDAAVVDAEGATVYGIDGRRGRLVLEVTKEPMAEVAPLGTVWEMRVDPLDYPLTSLALGDAGAWCAIG
jgi:hypothetical protein